MTESKFELEIKALLKVNHGELSMEDCHHRFTIAQINEILSFQNIYTFTRKIGRSKKEFIGLHYTPTRPAHVKAIGKPLIVCPCTYYPGSSRPSKGG
jgi:hypothetical protein